MTGTPGGNFRGAGAEATPYRRIIDVTLYDVCCGTNGVVITPPEIRTVAIGMQVVVLTAPVLPPGTSPPARGERLFV